ncbi:MAG: carboxymuconolactone decarboxylase family protein [Acidobacteria bacterium]|nr:carboxymuconolactone decarboxylase family protein [Acidobacteriota bacterium]MBS1864389.1 carboxymuconolactone decarboxylase family protein [Acidobacteriota bacterium]
MSESRIQLQPRDQVTPEIGAVYDALLAARGVVPNMFKVLAHTPAIAPAVAGFLKPLLSDGALKGWYKELVAVRISQCCACEYAIRAHSISARQKGASDDQITAIADFENGPFSPKEKLGFRLAGKLHQGGPSVDDAFFSELRANFSEAELVELFLTAAAFEMFPRFIDGLRIPATPSPAAK